MRQNPMNRTLLLAIAGLAAGVLHAVTATAAVVTVTDCVGDPHIVIHNGTRTTRLAVGGDDLILRCALAPLGQTDNVEVSGANVTIEGAASSVSAGGTGTSVRIFVDGDFVAINTNLEASNTNASMDIIVAGNVSFSGTDVTVGGISSGGDLLLTACTNPAPPCTITAVASTFKSREIEVIGVGDVTFSGVTMTTNSPRDEIRIVSTAGNVQIGASTTSGQGTGSECTEGNLETQFNGFMGGPESNFIVEAFGFVDLTAARVTVAENIRITSGVGAGVASVPAFIDATGAILRNDIGKKGEVEILADETSATITITGTTLIDDNESLSVEDVSELNLCETVPRAGCINLVGTPSTDS